MTEYLISLTPTLWRTCRAVANIQRLRLFQSMIDQPPQAMGKIALKCKIPEAICSLYLRHLNARGLCLATRQSRWVFYQLKADPKVRHSEIIMQTLISTLRNADESVYEHVFRDVTAFTHPRRITIVQVLKKYGKAQTPVLCKHCEMSSRAMERQLDKLARRGFVEQKGEFFCLASPSSPLAKTLVKIATESDTP